MSLLYLQNTIVYTLLYSSAFHERCALKVLTDLPWWAVNLSSLSNLVKQPSSKQANQSINQTNHILTDANSRYVVKFGVLFSDDRCANLFEALVGTLRAAKRKKIVHYEGELLLQGVHDNVDVTLLKEE